MESFLKHNDESRYERDGEGKTRKQFLVLVIPSKIVLESVGWDGKQMQINVFEIYFNIF